MHYVMEVANHFLARCGSTTVLNSTDFTIIAEWEKQGIPLAVVLDSIDEVCSRGDEKGGKPRSISDLQSVVKQRFCDWLQINSGVDQARM